MGMPSKRFRGSEALFQPSMLGLKAAGIRTTIYNSILNCDLDIRREFYGNAVLSGDTTIFPDTAWHHMQKGLTALTALIACQDEGQDRRAA
ncbi:putative aortic smooth muscle [Mycena amicta]|nr:putative aortic smooth muscle [Mycena amicta]